MSFWQNVSSCDPLPFALISESLYRPTAAVKFLDLIFFSTLKCIKMVLSCFGFCVCGVWVCVCVCVPVTMRLQCKC